MNVTPSVDRNGRVRKARSHPATEGFETINAGPSDLAQGPLRSEGAILDPARAVGSRIAKRVVRWAQDKRPAQRRAGGSSRRVQTLPLIKRLLQSATPSGGKGLGRGSSARMIPTTRIPSFHGALRPMARSASKAQRGAGSGSGPSQCASGVEIRSSSSPELSTTRCDGSTPWKGVQAA